MILYYQRCFTFIHFYKVFITEGGRGRGREGKGGREDRETESEGRDSDYNPTDLLSKANHCTVLTP